MDSLLNIINQEIFEKLRDYIFQKSGLSYSSIKEDQLTNAVNHRMKVKKCTSLKDYYEMVANDARQKEFKEVVKLLTIGETYFFRHEAQFNLIEKEILDKIILKKGEFKIWSAGCSSGEEPYTIALIALGRYGDLCYNKISIIGTDINENALEQARQGIYNRRAIKLIPESYMRKFFVKLNEMNAYQLKENVRKMVDFKYLNLVEDAYPSFITNTFNVDLILCRNVTIYFNKEVTQKIIEKFYNCLKDDGYLIIGHSETLQFMETPFELVKMGDSFVYKKSAGKSLISRFVQMEEVLKKQTKTEKPKQPKIQQVADYQEELDEEDADEFVNLHYKKAEEYAKKGMFKEAISECQKCLGEDSLIVPAYFLMGDCYLNLGNKEVAMENFKKTLYLEPSHVLARFNTAKIYHEEGRKKEAVREYKNTIRYLRNKPEKEFVYGAKGYTYGFLYLICENALEDLRKIQDKDEKEEELELR